jgi:hypothetical protein
MPLDVNLTTFVTLTTGIVVGVLSALYGPFLKEWVETRADKKELRRSLYRELLNWYELALFYVKSYDEFSEDNFLRPLPSMSVRKNRNCTST